MDVLFIHPKFPAQFRRLATRLAREPGYTVWALGDASWMPAGIRYPGINLLSYPAAEPPSGTVHPFARNLDAAVRRAREVVQVLLAEKRKGFEPQVIYVHPGWGDGLFLQDLFPTAVIVGLLEYYYHAHGADVGFDPEFPRTIDDLFRIRLLNTVQLHALQGCTQFMSPTAWQRSRYPAAYQDQIQLLHEGIDTAVVRPDALATITLPDGATFNAGDEVLTYVSRALEPYRGFHCFMRALPAILRARPQCHVVIAGEDAAHYGRPPPEGGTWRDVLLREVGGELDMSRVHFTGVLAYPDYLKLLQVSRVHVYLTYPFVLSWSMLEAMCTGCLLLASDTPPVAEVVRNGHNGLLFPFFDTGALAELAVRTLADPESHLPLRENARATIRMQYDFDEIVYPRHLAMLSGVKNG